MLVASLDKGDIYKQTSVYIELDKCPTNKHQVARLIQDYPLIGVNPANDSYYVCEGISREDLIQKCQVSSGEFDKLAQDCYSLSLI